jgi:hypothetical protein
MQLCVGAAKVTCFLRLPEGVAELAPGAQADVTLAFDAVLPGGTVVDRFTAWAEAGLRVALRDGSHGVVAANGVLVWGGTCAVGTVTGVTHAW